MFPTQTRLEQVLIPKDVEGKIQECQTAWLLATAENSPELFGDFPGISSDEIANIPHCNVLAIGADPAEGAAIQAARAGSHCIPVKKNV